MPQITVDISVEELAKIIINAKKDDLETLSLLLIDEGKELKEALLSYHKKAGYLVSVKRGCMSLYRLVQIRIPILLIPFL